MCIEVYNNILKDLNVSVRILIVIFLVFMLFITNSIFFLAFEFILVLILILLTDFNIKKISKSLIIFIYTMPVILLIYILFKNNILFFSIKILITIFFLRILFFATSFLGIYNGIFTLLKLYYKDEKKLNIRSLNISSKLYFIDKFFGDNERFNRAIEMGLEKKQIKNYIKTKYLMAKYDSDFIKNKLKLKIYKAKSEKINRKSEIFLILSIILMIMVVVKGVI